MAPVDHRSTPRELQRRLEAMRAGLPFVTWSGADGEQRLLALDPAREHVTLGRAESCDVVLELDAEASRLHAELQRRGGQWLVVDDGLSRNGTYVNGERVVARRRLMAGDVIRCGATLVAFHDPAPAERATALADGQLGEVRLTDAQRRVLDALCRPLRDGGPYALPVTNRAIAEELFLSVDAVKGHLRTLFEKLTVEDLPHNQKRLRLVERAVQAGLIGAHELG